MYHGKDAKGAGEKEAMKKTIKQNARRTKVDLASQLLLPEELNHIEVQQNRSNEIVPLGLCL